MNDKTTQSIKFNFKKDSVKLYRVFLNLLLRKSQMFIVWNKLRVSKKLFKKFSLR